MESQARVRGKLPCRCRDSGICQTSVSTPRCRVTFRLISGYFSVHSIWPVHCLYWFRLPSSPRAPRRPTSGN